MVNIFQNWLQLANECGSTQAVLLIHVNTADCFHWQIVLYLRVNTVDSMVYETIPALN